MRLDIDVLPILPQQREFIISGTDGSNTVESPVTVSVTPTMRNDVYLIISQSNAVGYGKAGEKRACAGQPNERHARILQANVRLTKKDGT